jgi:hypothetical protein
MEAIHSVETQVDFYRIHGISTQNVVTSGTALVPAVALTTPFAMLPNWMQVQDQFCHLKVTYS